MHSSTQEKQNKKGGQLTLIISLVIFLWDLFLALLLGSFILTHLHNQNSDNSCKRCTQPKLVRWKHFGHSVPKIAITHI